MLLSKRAEFNNRGRSISFDLEQKGRSDLQIRVVRVLLNQLGEQCSCRADCCAMQYDVQAQLERNNPNVVGVLLQADFASSTSGPVPTLSS
jgi:hypothetical protein